MDLLFELGLLKIDENNKVRPVHKLLHTKQDVQDREYNATVTH